MSKQNQTAKRHRRKILTLTSSLEGAEKRNEILLERISKSDKEIVILQEDLADAAKTVLELSPTEEP